jgi:hypothetical protein
MLIIEWNIAKLDTHLQVCVRIIPFTIFQIDSIQHYSTKLINDNLKQNSVKLNVMNYEYYSINVRSVLQNILLY